MKRPVVYLGGIAAAAAAALFALNFRIDGLEEIQLRRRVSDGSTADRTNGSVLPTAAEDRSIVRIASWDAGGLDATRASDPKTLDLVARQLGQFDLWVFQNLGSTTPAMWDQLFTLAGPGGRSFERLTLAPPPNGENAFQYAIVYDPKAMRVDRQYLHTVGDPDDLFTYDPLVARVATTARPDQAFTFTLLCVWLDPENLQRELAALDDLFYAVRDRSGGEDDVVLVGNFQSPAETVLDAFPRRAVQVLTRNMPADVLGERFGPQIVLDPQATREYAGRAGTYDTLREFNLTVAEVEQVSPWMPIWAEFARHEGTQMAAREERAPSRE